MPWLGGLRPKALLDAGKPGHPLPLAARHRRVEVLHSSLAARAEGENAVNPFEKSGQL